MNKLDNAQSYKKFHFMKMISFTDDTLLLISNNG